LGLGQPNPVPTLKHTRCNRTKTHTPQSECSYRPDPEEALLKERQENFLQEKEYDPIFMGRCPARKVAQGGLDGGWCGHLFIVSVVP
ncbi:hypothetical protein XENOCAPTIV_024312, partial [Xenoophorus captivus]